MRAPRRLRRGRVAIAAALVLLVAFVATTKVSFGWRLYGLYLLEAESGRPYELKDDLRLGDGPRLLAGVSFAPIREALSRSGGTGPRLEVDWDASAGGGVITNYLGDGQELQTVFGRYVDSLSKTPHGLFVGGAVADVAASPAQNQSGMAFRDARGWHHVWCSVNEVLQIVGDRLVSPGDWKFMGSRVLVDDPDRVVIESEHEIDAGGGVRLRMERFAYFLAGRPWFRLGVNVVNVGDRPVSVSYDYGDEPWVGEFGSAEGNIGWTRDGVFQVAAMIDPRANPGAGILDAKSGIANFLGWEGSTPDAVYFGNHAGAPVGPELGVPLTSNEIFIGAEWRNRPIAPGETFSTQLTIGLAASTPAGMPTFPPGALQQP